MLSFRKSNQTPSHLYSDEEKAEIRSIASFESKHNKKNIYDGHQYIAISPDGTQIATLNIATYQLKLCRSDNISKFTTLNYNNFKNAYTPAVVWSLSVSNEITLDDKTTDVLIAVSCFDDEFNGADSTIKHTWVISSAQQARISSSINDMGGIIKFLDYESSVCDKTDLVLVNAYGISKFSIPHEKLNTMIGENYDPGWFNFFSDKLVENFNLPNKLLSNTEISSFFIQQSLVKGRFVVESYKNKVQTVEMYNLKTTLLENTFQKSEENAASVLGRGHSCYAISNNESLFAYCRGANSISIYLMENSLEVTTKKFNESNIQILFFDFIKNDEKLLIVIEEERYNEDTSEIESTPIIVVWDLFNSSDNCVRRINDTFSLFPKTSERHQKLANSSGCLITIADDGNINPLLEDSEIVKLLEPVNSIMRNEIQFNKSNSSSSTAIANNTSTSYHSIYDVYGKYLDSKYENKIIIRNPEPWILNNKTYERTSVYLDDNKTIQLFIGESTVQVWRKRKSGTSSTKSSLTSSTRVLEFIWTNTYNRPMKIQSLEVGHNEFSLVLYIPSKNSLSEPGDKVTLEWPEKVNTPVRACEALEFFNKKKGQPLDPKRQHQFDDLIQQTEHIVKKYLTKSHGLWRMLDIRFDIMTNLIRGNCTYIIKIILFSVKDGKNNYLHIPRRYFWGGQNVKETDLEIAVACTKGGYRKDTIIVKYLLEYYSNNALSSPNWMFTVAKAIPVLYEYNLEFYVKELFQKPCFGASEVFLDQSKIRVKDMDRSNHKDVHALNVKLGLTKKKGERNFLSKSIVEGKQSGEKIITDIVNKTTSAPNSSLINQVYMVPLPDFTVYPEKFEDKREEYWKIPFKFLKLLFWPRGHVIKKKHQLSSFLRMIREDNNAEIYDNPSMAAVIDFKWNAARNHFLRHALIYVAFALLFAIINGAIKGASDKITSDWGALIIFVAFYWLGFYLLNTERIQLKYEKWKRYFGLYNFFDLISVIFPLVMTSLNLYYSNIIPDNFDNLTQDQKEPFVKDYRIFTIFNSFAVLIMWLELFLLLRYFERSGAYIYIIVNILKQIIPFLIFILVVVLGFGHAMFVLLNDTEGIGIDPNGSSFTISDENGQTLPYTVDQKFDVKSISDNYFTNFVKSVESVFFWTGGRWDQLEQWNFWPVDVYSIIASILLVTILQNMLIAIMTGAYEDAKEIGRHAVLEYRAELIEDYETIEKPLGSKRGNPRYIYYIGKSDYIEEWLRKTEKARKHHENFLLKIADKNPWDDDDNNDYENDHYKDLLYAYSTEVDSISSPRKDQNQEIPLSLYWFVDENNEIMEKSLKTKPSTIISKPISNSILQNDNQDETRMLKEKIQSMEKEFSGKLNSMEESIKNLISIIQSQK